ncbi:hypothetical protein HDU81_007831 [Chytriomyces hyalinus]|nr:hypothetical protein HDU81_007831 [Chytriomyces hyalinus]
MSPVSPAGSDILDVFDVFCEEAWAPLELSETEKECDNNHTDSRRTGAGGNANHADKPPKSTRRSIRGEKREMNGGARKPKAAGRESLCKSESYRASKACIRCAARETSLWRRGPAGSVFHTLCNSCYLKSKRNEAYLHHSFAISHTNNSPDSKPHSHSIMDADFKSMNRTAIESEIRVCLSKRPGSESDSLTRTGSAEHFSECDSAAATLLHSSSSVASTLLSDSIPNIPSTPPVNPVSIEDSLHSPSNSPAKPAKKKRRRKAPVFNKKRGSKAAAAAARRAAELAAAAETVEPEDATNHEDENDDDESAAFLHNVEHQEEDPNKVYCYCRQPYDPDLFYIQCDGCDEWYHGVCANIKDDEAERIFLWFCRICERDSGRRPVFKKFCSAWLAGDECRLWAKEMKAQMKAAASLVQASQQDLTTGSAGSILPSAIESIAEKIPVQCELVNNHALVSAAPTHEHMQPTTPIIPNLQHQQAPELHRIDPGQTNLSPENSQSSEMVNMKCAEAFFANQESRLNDIADANENQQNQVETTNQLAPQPQISAVPETTDSAKAFSLPEHPSHMFKTPKSCLKYLPDPIAPRLNQNTSSGTDKKSNLVPTSISGGTSSRYCSDECGLSVSRHAFRRALVSASTPKSTPDQPSASPTTHSALPPITRASLQLHPRIHLSLHERAVSSRSEIYSLEAYDALDRERLLKYARQRESLVQRVRACESVQEFLEGCSWRAAVVNWFAKNRVRRAAENGCGGEGYCVLGQGLDAIGEDVDKENAVDSLDGGVICKSTLLNNVDSKVKAARKKKRRIRNGGCDGSEGNGQKASTAVAANESPLCGFDSRILECFQLMDNHHGSENRWGEEDEDGIDMDALENAASIDDVKGAIVETICTIPVEACKSHHDWEDLKMSEVQLEIETLVETFKEICEEESRIIDTMRKRRTLMRMTL